ncbi:Nuclear factor NF-kappa-B p110 subunit [Sergentomyia squamirostris]
MSTLLNLDSRRCEVVYDNRGFTSTPSPVSNSSTSDGSESTYNYPVGGLGQLTSDMTQMLNLQTGQNAAQPRLVIIHQPQDKFRFRYKSEMHGSHGCLMAATTDKAKKLFPTVELEGFNGEAIIQCSLYQTDPDRLMPHSHKLVVRSGDEDREDPHNITVTPGNPLAEFRSMGIIHTAKKNIAEELFRKLKTVQEAKQGDTLSYRDEEKLRKIASQEEKNMNLNQVCLHFQCFVRDSSGHLVELCKPILSTAINNMKSALTGELKIARMSCAAGSAEGGDDLFLFVEKVNKKNIKVKFYEEDDYGETSWKDWGNFTEIDVHHQYGIALTTPAYRDKKIRSDVEVKIQLVRPSDGCVSEPLCFTYRSCFEASAPRKRPRPNESFTSGDLPVTIAQYNPADLPRISQEFGDEIKRFIGMNSSEMDVSDINFSEDLFNHLAKNSDEYKGILQESDMGMGILCNDAPTVKEDSATLEERLKSGGLPRDNPSIYEKILQIVRLYGTTMPIKVEKIVEHLLVDSKKHGENLLHWAIRENGNRVKNILEIVNKYNLNHYLDTVNDRNENCLHVACALDKVEFIRPLINLGANPNRRDINGNTPLHVSVAEGHHMCIARIIDRTNYTQKSKELDINLANYQGMTALHLAVKNRDLEAVRRLVEAGASVKMAEHKHGNSILHVAVAESAVEIVRFLLQKTHLSVNQTNTSGYTPLHLACASTETKDCKEIVKLLLEHKADPMMVNENCNELSVVEEEEVIPNDDDADIDRARNSFELAQNKPEILTVLQQFKNLSQEVKNEKMEIEKEFKVKKSSLLDDVCSSKLCDIFNVKDLWKQLAILLDQSAQISICERSSNPTKTLFNVIEMHGSSLDDLLKAFDFMKMESAITCVHEMIGRNYHKTITFVKH